MLSTGTEQDFNPPKDLKNILAGLEVNQSLSQQSHVYDASQPQEEEKPRGSLLKAYSVGSQHRVRKFQNSVRNIYAEIEAITKEHFESTYERSADGSP